MKLARYLPLATSPLAALSVFNVYRRAFGIELHGWMAQVAAQFESVVHGALNFGPERVTGWHPPTFLSDFWVISFWWTGVLTFGTVQAMKDKGAPTHWLSHVVMIPNRIFVGYSLIGFFLAAATVPITFARFKSGDDDLDRYGHWVRVYIVSGVACVAMFFLLNHFA
ncbi:hypothetical protein [Hyphomonas sp. GM-8P]|uniref:hypothetical protein n=1 Tax=Hyphomonas sp. GM-8P TaxID=1280945 RepID=UPI000DC04B31|nr:hypothetical protein [Hyphomonas sp. GM-8P]RAN38195.1 hypothetical protein HY26_18220 [Hyphomonas sp. GM-8P]